MDVDNYNKDFITTIKEEPNKCDVSIEERKLNMEDFLEQGLVVKEEVSGQSAENIDINNTFEEPLKNIQIKNEPELCLEDKVPSEHIHVENESVLCLVQIPLENIQVKNEAELLLEDQGALNSSHLDDTDLSHQKDSTKEKEQYTCDICDKGFTLSIKLKVHKRKNTCKKLYKCETCPLTFGNKSDLIAHLLTHIDTQTSGIEATSKRFSCGECFKEFTELQSFKIHVGLHTGDKPFKCDICDSAFIRNSHLTTHKLIHTKKKNHKCGICDKKFHQLSNLKQHQLTHTGMKPFKCNFCDKQFGHNKNLKQHTRTYHMDALQLAPFE